MKVIIIISNSGVGGAQRVAMHLTKWLCTQPNCEAKLIGLQHTQAKTYDMSELNYDEICSKHIIAQLRKKIQQFQPDIVVSMGVPMVIYTAPACWRLGVKHIVSERNDPSHFAGRTSVRILAHLLMRTANGFVFQTKDAQRFYRMHEGTKSTVIPNPIAVHQNEKIEAWHGEREKRIVSVGRLNKQKNHLLLIDAFSEIAEAYPEYKLYIYGDGKERAELEDRIGELNLIERVRLPGIIENVYEHTYKASAFVMSSDFEGMPNALMEALSYGIPCISTDCPCYGPRELIKSGENGYLVPVGDKTALKQRIIEIITSNELQKMLSRNAQKIIETHNIENVCLKWFNYLKLIGDIKLQ